MELKSVMGEIVGELKVLQKEDLNNQADDLIGNLIKIKDNNSNIFVYGAGRSGFIGKALVMRLVQAGFPAYFVGESSTPSMNSKDLLILLSGSGKTDVVRKILTISKDNGLEIVLITSNPQENFSGIEEIIAVEGKTKIDTNNSSLPLGSYFELNTFVFLECLLAKLIDQNPQATESMDEVARKYRENKLIVF
jgi:6-phospho-3-hexuloisomerase